MTILARQADRAASYDKVGVMKLLDWYLAPLKKFAVFGGRAGRAEFWTFFGINVALGLVLAQVEYAASLTDEWGWGPLSSPFELVIAIPTLAVMTRRLHDTGRTGWWVLLNAIPLGFLVVLGFMLDAGQEGSNGYGKNPVDPTERATRGPW